MVTFPHGETNISLACQNKCVSCNHFIPEQANWYADPQTVERDLNAASKVMHFQRYNLVGGEPTLHRKLLDLLDILRTSGITDTVEITTNGQSYRHWKDDMYRMIDELIVTPYKLSETDKSYIADKCREFGVSLQWHPVIFTWAAYKRPHDPAVAKGLYQTCWYRFNRNVIDEGYFYRCCIGRFIPSVLLGKPKEFEGLPLEDITEDKLRDYMGQDETPLMCSVCASNRGAVIPWRETTREKWLTESLG